MCLFLCVCVCVSVKVEGLINHKLISRLHFDTKEIIHAHFCATQSRRSIACFLCVFTPVIALSLLFSTWAVSFSFVSKGAKSQFRFSCIRILLLFLTLHLVRLIVLITKPWTCHPQLREFMMDIHCFLTFDINGDNSDNKVEPYSICNMFFLWYVYNI